MWKILVCTELLYVSLSTFISLKYSNDALKGELLRTLIRSITLVIYAYIYNGNRKKQHQPSEGNHRSDKKVMFLSIVIMMLFPLLFLRAGFTGALRIVWILSSFIVGFREELFYRGLLQNKISEKYPLLPALISTSIVFTVYHVVYFIGGQWIPLIQVFIWSLFIGIIYIKTGNIVVVSFVHGMYDAIPFITPFQISGIPYFYGLIFVGISTLMLFPLVKSKGNPQNHLDS